MSEGQRHLSGCRPNTSVIIYVATVAVKLKQYFSLPASTAKSFVVIYVGFTMWTKIWRESSARSCLCKPLHVEPVPRISLMIVKAEGGQNIFSRMSTSSHRNIRDCRAISTIRQHGTNRCHTQATAACASCPQGLHHVRIMKNSLKPDGKRKPLTRPFLVLSMNRSS